MRFIFQKEINLYFFLELPCNKDENQFDSLKRTDDQDLKNNSIKVNRGGSVFATEPLKICKSCKKDGNA